MPGNENLSAEMTDKMMEYIISLHAGQAEIKGNIVALGIQTEGLAQMVARQNGNVAELMAWRQKHMLDKRHVEGIAEGRLMVRAEDRARVALIGRVLQNEYVRLALMAGGIGAVVRLWPW